MHEIYELFRGAIAPVEVLLAAGTRPEARFFAHLYIGLYFEALGNETDAGKHVAAAAEDRYAGVGGYMHMVARVHHEALQAR
jgi:lipoprotein NlpI